MSPSPAALTAAVRQWHEPVNEGADTAIPSQRTTRAAPPTWPDTVLFFDTETTVDSRQQLNFGWYRYARRQSDGTLATLAEGLFHADDLPTRDPAGFATLQAFVREHHADTATGQQPIAFLTRRAFVNNVLWPALQADALICGFNLPFDLARLAVRWGETRRRRKRTKGGMPPPDVFTRGFSLVLWEYQDRATKEWKEHKYRPRVRIKHVDNKRAFIGLAPPRKRDRRDPQHGGRFLDLKTLAFAQTNRGHKLESACEAFGIAEGKAKVDEHGVITPEYIAYARQDVRSYVGLLERLRAEFDRHPIDLLPERAQSPASIAKAYLRAMGITSPLERTPAISRSVLGRTMSGYYGGRTECRIRRVPVSVVYVDFLSMYPTVNSLMDLWRFVTAEHIEVVDATVEVQAVLDEAAGERCFDSAIWRQLPFYARIVPDGDILPVRTQYDGHAFTIGVNPLTADRPLWYAGPDLVASTLLTGKPPTVVQAFRLVPHGALPTLQPVALSAVLPIDPRTDNFFRFVIEERKRIKQAKARGEAVPDHPDSFLKVLANSGGYGIFAELNRQELPEEERVPITVYGAGAEPFPAKTNAPELPGKTCYPPLAALITSAARLMLALLEREVTDRGGSYAFCDTDSMAIVATEQGGLVPCPGGPYRLSDGTDAVKALSWQDIEAIVQRFAQLNPYDRAVVPGSVLEMEDINRDPETGQRRQLWCYAISAKRYAFFTRDTDGTLAVVDDGYSEHGLGHLLNPGDPDSDSRAWIRTVWTGIVTEALGLPFTWPAWCERPAMSRITASSPRLLRPLNHAANGSDGGIQPFNFLISPHVAPLGHPASVDPAHFHLVAPYTKDARQWSKLRWTDVYSGDAFAITTRATLADGRTARVQSYGDVIARYRTHPEAKSLGPDGLPCGRRTVGWLQRRPVTLGEIVYVGKETNKLEEVEAGGIHDWNEVQLVLREPDISASLRTSPHADCDGGQRSCATCGAPLVRAAKRYCSSRCRQRAYRQRKQRALVSCDAD